MWCFVYDMSTSKSETHVAYNFNSFVKTVELLKVISSHVHCKCDKISEIRYDTVYLPALKSRRDG